MRPEQIFSKYRKIFTSDLDDSLVRGPFDVLGEGAKVGTRKAGRSIDILKGKIGSSRAGKAGKGLLGALGGIGARVPFLKSGFLGLSGALTGLVNPVTLTVAGVALLGTSLGIAVTRGEKTSEVVSTMADFMEDLKPKLKTAGESILDMSKALVNLDFESAGYEANQLGRTLRSVFDDVVKKAGEFISAIGHDVRKALPEAGKAIGNFVLVFLMF